MFIWAWYFGVLAHTKKQLESGSVTTDLRSTVVDSYKLLGNDVKQVSLENDEPKRK